MIAKIKTMVAVCTMVISVGRLGFAEGTLRVATPVIKNFSSKGGTPQNRANDRDLIYMVKPGDEITFSITTDKSCEHVWSVRQGSKVLGSETKRQVRQSTFAWKVPQTKATWDIGVIACGRKAPVGPAWKNQKTWSITTSALKTIKPGESIQAAIDSLPAKGGIVELVTGTFVLSQTGEITLTSMLNQVYYGLDRVVGKYRYAVLINKSNVTIRGAGTDKTKLTSPGTTLPAYHVFLILKCSNVSISDVFLTSGIPAGRWIPPNVSGAKYCVNAPEGHPWANVLASEGHAIHLWGKAHHVSISDVRVERLHSPVTTAASIWSIDAEAVSNLLVSNCLFLRNRGGILFINTHHDTVTQCESGYSQGSYGIDLNVRCCDNVVEKSVFHHNANSGMKVYGGCQRNVFRDNLSYENGSAGGHGMQVWSSPRDTTIVGNTLRDNKHDGLYICEQGSINNTYAANNRIYNNGRYGISVLKTPRGKPGIHPDNVVIKSNTVFSNKEDGIRVDIKNRKVTVANNIIAGNGGWGINRLDSEVILSHNDVWNNKGGDYNGCAAGEDSLSADPLFANPSEGDFRLKSKAGRWNSKLKKWVKDKVHSPCIDTGDPKAEHKNEPKPNGRRINMGAYGNTKEASRSTAAKPQKQPGLVIATKGRLQEMLVQQMCDRKQQRTVWAVETSGDDNDNEDQNDDGYVRGGGDDGADFGRCAQ